MSMLSRRAVLLTQKFKVGDLETDLGTLTIQLDYSTDFTRFFSTGKDEAHKVRYIRLKYEFSVRLVFTCFHPNCVL